MKTTKRNSTFSTANVKLPKLRSLSLFLFAYLFVFYQGSAGATGTPISIYAPAFDAATIASFQLNGNAVRTGDNKLQLTSNAGGQSGSAFWKSRIYLGTDKSFSAYFTFLINGSLNGGADGLAFVIQTSTVDAGSMGGGIGYAGISPSIAVEFDTYDNGENGGGNHVAIVEDGCPYCVHTNYAVPSFALDGGTVGHVWVDYNGTTDLFEVRLSTTTTRPATALVSATKDLATKFAGSNVFVGFTAATGGSSSNHYIQDLLFENSFNSSGVNPSGSFEQAGVYTISYHVTSDGSTAVPGASVAVNGVTLTTDGSGNASLSLADGVYPYTVSKTGSTSVTGTTTVSAAPVTQNITLVIPPTIIVSPTSLNLGYVVPGGTSGEMSYTLSGIVLSPSSGNITITPPANFEVSFTSGSGFSASSITVTYTSGSLAATTVYVRFKPTSTAAYSGSITNSGGTATTQNVDLTGTSVFSYCTATTSNTCCMGINNVTFNTINNSTGNTNYIYSDYTAVSTNVTQGRAYTLSITGYSNPQYFRAWFDWNHDGDFDDAGELYDIGNGMEASSSVTIPSDATTGNVRMRVRSEYAYNSPPTACGNVQYGECEEYTVNVEEPGPTIFISPTSLDLGYVATGGISGGMSYTLSGSLLSPSDGNITITPPANFEVSFTPGSGFSSSAITAAYSSGALNQRNIYVRFKPTSVTSYLGSIINSGGSATTQNVDLTGTSVLSYCTATTNETCCMGINNVTFNSINNSTDNVNYIYSDFTGLSTNVTKGSTYTLSVTGYDNPQYFMAWFDWNQDGDFADEGEEFSIDGDGYYSSAMITISLGAATGNIRMRIRSEYYDYSLPQSCGNVEYGECEDYTLIVEDAAPIVWDGSVSVNWNTPGNWSSNSVPTITDNVRIPVTGNNPVIALNIGANCNNLNVETNARLTVQSGGSLITNGTITNTGTIDIQRSISKDRWHLVSSPVTNAKSNIFKDDYLQSWDEASATWSDIVSTQAALNPVQGYSLWTIYPADHTYTFTGTPNTGNQSLSLTSNGTGGNYKGANLLGNPYPSSIDWSMLDYTYGAVYYWIGNGTNGDGSYAAWNDYIGTGSQYIAPMQGFFVVAPSGGTFSLSNANRVHSNSTYYKSAVEITDNLLVLETVSKGISDELYVNLNAEATEDFDLQYDAYKFASGTPGLSELYSYSGDKKLSIDVRPASEVMQLGFSNSLSGDYQIGISQINGIADAILEDTKTGTFTDLQEGNYSFSYIAGEPDKRFKLHFGTLGIGDKLTKSVSIYSNRKTAFVNLDKGDIFIYNITGQLVAKKLSANGMNEINLDNTGNYIVKVVTDKSLLVKKIFVQ